MGKPVVPSDLDRDQMQAPIIKKALKDPAFRKRLIANPKKVIAEIVGIEIPDHVQITVLEESLQQFYVTIPAPLPPLTGELQDEHLEAVAGGKARNPPPPQEPPTCGPCTGGTSKGMEGIDK